MPRFHLQGSGLPAAAPIESLLAPAQKWRQGVRGLAAAQ